MAKQTNRMTPEEYLKAFETMGTIQPSSEWTEAVSTALMAGLNKQQSTIRTGMILPLLLFFALNGLLVISVIAPSPSKINSRQQTLQQVQEELFIQATPIK